MTYTCPVCGFQNLPVPPRDFEICPSCGTEFEYHDALRSHAELRAEWVRQGARWQSRVIMEPVNWNPMNQLVSAGFFDCLPAVLDSTYQEVGV
jgi:hypothetical protein